MVKLLNVPSESKKILSLFFYCSGVYAVSRQKSKNKKNFLNPNGMWPRPVPKYLKLPKIY